jgi:hypothetical protein
MHAIQGDRRPAIWPWLVMPLVALTLFYWFYSLDQTERAKDFGPAPTAGAHAPAASETPLN